MPKATYTVNLTLSGKANDKIYIKIGEVGGRSLGWTLWGTTVGGSETDSNKTGMIFRKI